MFTSAAAALLVGSLVYIFDRDWSTALFLAPFQALEPTGTSFFGNLGGFLPAFLHAFAIPVLVIAVLSARPRRQPWVCLFWFGIATGLEALQLQAVAAWLPTVGGIPGGSHLFQFLQAYAVQGFFDVMDIVVTAFGCLFALVLTRLIKP